MERALARARPLRHRGRPRPRALPRPGRRGGHVRHRATRSVHLRRVGQRRLPRLAVQRSGGRGSPQRARVHARRRRLLRRPAADRRLAPDRPRRARDPDADRERVRGLRLRQGLSARAGRPHARRRNHRSLHHHRPAHRPDARRRQPARTAQDGLVRIEGSRTARDPARAPEDRPAHVRRVLGRLVRPLGRPPPRDRRGRVGAGTRRASGRRRLGEHLHVPRRNELRLHERRQRQGRLPADRHVVRLRRPAHGVGRPRTQVLGVPRRHRALRAGSGRDAGRGRRRTRDRGRARRARCAAGCPGRVGRGRDGRRSSDHGSAGAVPGLRVLPQPHARRAARVC